jgi:hypothetical protein
MNKISWNKQDLWQGCVLASIAHAINVAHFPELSHEHSWDGFNYNIQDSSGTRGTITFHPKYVVAAFRNESSERLLSPNNALDYFKDSPEEVKELAERETLQYLLDEVGGKTVPVISTAFWGDNQVICSQDEFIQILENGGFLLEAQASDVETAIQELQDYYEMSEPQIKLLKSIFKRKIDAPSEIIVLTLEEVRMLESDDEEGLAESKISFEEIGIKWYEQ